MFGLIEFLALVCHYLNEFWSNGLLSILPVPFSLEGLVRLFFLPTSQAMICFS